MKKPRMKRLKPWQEWVAVTKDGKHAIRINNMAAGTVDGFLKATNTRLGTLELREVPLGGGKRKAKR